MSDEAMKIGDLVWAKMKGFSPWPGKITSPFGDMKRPKSAKQFHCVWFFGTNNHAWVEDYCIKTYADNREQLITTCKTLAFKDAVAAIDDYIARKEAGEDVDKQFDLDQGAALQKLELKPSTDDFDETTFTDDEPEQPVEKKRRGTITSNEENSSDELKTRTPVKSPRGSTRAASSTPRKRKVAQENGDSVPTTPKPRRSRRSSTSSSISAVSSSSKSKVNNSSAQRKSAATNLLNRPSNFKKPVVTPINVQLVSQTLKNKQIKPSELRFGFLGLGNMGSGIVKNLINSGHRVVVWNRTTDKCKPFVAVGADQGMTPSDVISSADITFSCVSDQNVAKEMVFGNCGVLSYMDANKGYVEMTGIDCESSSDIADAISSKGGRYLEAQMQGSKSEAEEGTLVVLAAGDRSLYDECLSAFAAMSKESFFLGVVGNAAKMNMVLQLIQGVALTGLSEGMALADRANLAPKDVLDILALTTFQSKMIREKGEAIIEGSFAVQQPLQYMQKDLNMALLLGNSLEQPLPVTASANEVFKHAKRLGYGEHDASAVYIRARF